MFRWSCILLLALATNSFANASDYLLRIETYGYRDKVASKKPPEEELLSSVETLATAGRPFSSSCKVGNRTIQFKGNLKQRESGFVATFIYDSQEPRTVLNPNGEKVPVMKRGTRLQTSLKIDIGKPYKGLPSDTVVQSPGKPDRISRTRRVITLEEFKQ